MTTPRIPFNKPFIAGKELYYVAQAVTYGNLGGDGRFTQACCRFLEERFGIGKVLLVPSCTAALEMAAMLFDLKPGDEVILPSFTFVSTANAVARLGAKPVFVDIRPDTLNLDDALVEEAITERTRAIFPVHYAGVACEMDRIMTIAAKYGLRVAEDAAQGVNAFYDGRALGSIGDLGCYSFHETKNYICGEGGALCVNDPALGRTRRDPPREGDQPQAVLPRPGGQVHLGRPRLQLRAQRALLGLPPRPARDARRHQRAPPADLPVLPPRPGAAGGRGPAAAAVHPRGLPRATPTCSTSSCPTGETRDGLMAHLKRQGIHAVFHYVPLHTSPMGQSFGYREGDLPMTEDISRRLLRLPLFYDITEAEQGRVVEQVGAYFAKTAVAVVPGPAFP